MYSSLKAWRRRRRRQLPPRRDLRPMPPSPCTACRQLVTDAAHPPRAADIHELRALQKARGERDASAAEERAASLSHTLASRTRRVRAAGMGVVCALTGMLWSCPVMRRAYEAGAAAPWQARLC